MKLWGSYQRGVDHDRFQEGGLFSSGSITVRAAAEADFEAVGQLTVDVYVREGYSPGSAAGLLQDARRRATHTVILVAEMAGLSEIVGAVSLARAGSPFAQIATADEAEVRLLATAPEARGRGVGEALMHGCIDLARAAGAARLVLSTQLTMVAAQRLYARLGMRRVPGRDWVSPHGDARLVYDLELAPAG